MPTSYSDIPALSKWMSDSSVTFAVRKNDRILARIDALIDTFWKAGDNATRSFVTCDLYFTLDYWLKEYRSHPKFMDKGRLPAIQALYERVVHRLCGHFNIGTSNLLPRELELAFGRRLSDHGVKLDHEWDAAMYLTRAEARRYKVWFKGGLAYQFPWWDSSNGPGAPFELAWSSKGYNSAVFRFKDYAGFALSMSRDLYMGFHFAQDSNIGKFGNFYHSTYTGGDPVMCAGTMLVERGVIKRINTDSGHYQPDLDHVVSLLQTLQMHGVPLSGMFIEDHDGVVQASAVDFMTARGNWARLLSRKQANLNHIHGQLAQQKMHMLIHYWWLEGKSTGLYKTTHDLALELSRQYGWNLAEAKSIVATAIDRVETREKIQFARQYAQPMPF